MSTEPEPSPELKPKTVPAFEPALEAVADAATKGAESIVTAVVTAHEAMAARLEAVAPEPSPELKPNTGLCPEMDGSIRGLCFAVFHGERKFVVMAQDMEDARSIHAFITGGRELCERCVGAGVLTRTEIAPR